MWRFGLCVLVMMIGKMAMGAEQDAFSVRLLGVKVGEMRMAWQETATTYSVAARFTTTGLAGALSSVDFDVRASGRRTGPRYRPQRYVEQVNTGERVSEASMIWTNGLPRPDGERFDSPNRVPAQRIRGAVDPMTALFMAVKDREEAGLCDLRQTIFDGERLTQILFDGETRTRNTITCSGRFERLAGYSEHDLRNNAVFPLTVTYTSDGTRMKMQQIRVKTIYGDATVQRMR